MTPLPPRSRRDTRDMTDRIRRAEGPLGRLVSLDGEALRLEASGETAANSLIILNRVAFLNDSGGIDPSGRLALLRWAVEERLGQERPLVASASARRRQALAALAARGHAVTRLVITPEWRLAVGLGNRENPHEVGIARHGTYGWPVIPGQALKGLTAAHAAQSGADPAHLHRVFGLPHPVQSGAEPEPERTGTVRFLDALPLDKPVALIEDVLAPHFKPYYDTVTLQPGESRPPAEYNQPVPVRFLAVSGGQFAADLVSMSATDTAIAAEWCAAALDGAGVGAKTSSGYGFAATAAARQER